MNLRTKPTNCYSKNLEKAKMTYYSKLLHNYKTDSKRTWQVLKKITGKQKTKSNLFPRELKVDKIIMRNSQNIY